MDFTDTLDLVFDGVNKRLNSAPALLASDFSKVVGAGSEGNRAFIATVIAAVNDHSGAIGTLSGEVDTLSSTVAAIDIEAIGDVAGINTRLTAAEDEIIDLGTTTATNAGQIAIVAADLTEVGTSLNTAITDAATLYSTVNANQAAVDQYITDNDAAVGAAQADATAAAAAAQDVADNLTALISADAARRAPKAAATLYATSAAMTSTIPVGSSATAVLSGNDWTCDLTGQDDSFVFTHSSTNYGFITIQNGGTATGGPGVSLVLTVVSSADDSLVYEVADIPYGPSTYRVPPSTTGRSFIFSIDPSQDFVGTDHQQVILRFSL